MFRRLINRILDWLHDDPADPNARDGYAIMRHRAIQEWPGHFNSDPIFKPGDLHFKDQLPSLTSGDLESLAQRTN